MKILVTQWGRNGYLFAIICVAIATALFVLGRDFFAKGQWALLYLLIIVVIANIAGVRASLVASVLAFFTWNFFLLPPYNTLLIHDPKDLLSLIIFLIVGITMGLQAGRMRAREAEALAREQETALLNRLSASLVSLSSTRAMADTLLQEVISITGATSAILFLPTAEGRLSSVCLHEACSPSAQQQQDAAWVLEHNKAIGLPHTVSLEKFGVQGWPASVARQELQPGDDRVDLYLPVQSTSQTEGVLYIGERKDRQPYSPHDARVLVSTTHLVAGFLERQRLEMAASKVEAIREAERLKSTLVSSVSHELKTPLAAVTATITSLLEDDVAWHPDTARKELEEVSADLAHLNDSINALLDLSRLKSDAWMVKRDWFAFGEILGAVLNKLPGTHRQRVMLSVPEEMPPLYVDFQQWAQALQHLLENAFTYAPNSTPVLVGATVTPQELHLWVEDQGPGISAEEHERIFEQFFRGTAAATAPSGTGLGLAITAEIVRASGGRIWVEDVQPHGARFVIAMPREMATGDH
jgi:two-component system sensor histidine kinase KdpD